jgi:hypothetical protein
MIFYNWKKIHRATKGKVRDIITVIHGMTYDLMPKNKRDRLYKYYQKDFSGQSFLLYPERLFLHREEYEDIEIAQYVGIASQRSYAEYILSKDTTLDLFEYDGKDIILYKNRLLTVSENRIHFKFEDNKE